MTASAGGQMDFQGWLKIQQFLYSGLKSKIRAKK